MWPYSIKHSYNVYSKLLTVVNCDLSGGMTEILFSFLSICFHGSKMNMDYFGNEIPTLPRAFWLGFTTINNKKASLAFVFPKRMNHSLYHAMSKPSSASTFCSFHSFTEIIVSKLFLSTWQSWNMYFIHLFIFRANILVVPGTPDKYSQRFLSLKKIFKLVKSLLVMLFSFVPFLVR